MSREATWETVKRLSISIQKEIQRLQLAGLFYEVAQCWMHRHSFSMYKQSWCKTNFEALLCLITTWVTKLTLPILVHGRKIETGGLFWDCHIHLVVMKQENHSSALNSSSSGLAVCSTTGTRSITLLTIWLTSLSGKSAQKHQIQRE